MTEFRRIVWNEKWYEKDQWRGVDRSVCWKEAKIDFYNKFRLRIDRETLNGNKECMEGIYVLHMYNYLKTNKQKRTIRQKQ